MCVYVASVNYYSMHIIWNVHLVWFLYACIFTHPPASHNVVCRALRDFLTICSWKKITTIYFNAAIIIVKRTFKREFHLIKSSELFTNTCALKMNIVIIIIKRTLKRGCAEAFIRSNVWPLTLINLCATNTSHSACEDLLATATATVPVLLIWDGSPQFLVFLAPKKGYAIIGPGFQRFSLWSMR